MIHMYSLISIQILYYSPVADGVPAIIRTFAIAIATAAADNGCSIYCKHVCSLWPFAIFSCFLSSRFFFRFFFLLFSRSFLLLFLCVPLPFVFVQSLLRYSQHQLEFETNQRTVSVEKYLLTVCVLFAFETLSILNIHTQSTSSLSQQAYTNGLMVKWYKTMVSNSSQTNRSFSAAQQQ